MEQQSRLSRYWEGDRNDEGCVPCSSQEVSWNWGVEAFVSAQIEDCHGAVRLGLANSVGRVTVVDSLVFLPQRVDLGIQQTGLYDCAWPTSHSRLTALFSALSL